MNGGLFEQEADDRGIFLLRCGRGEDPERAGVSVQFHGDREHAAGCGSGDGPRDAGAQFRGTGDGQARERVVLHAQACGGVHVPRGVEGLSGDGDAQGERRAVGAVRR